VRQALASLAAGAILLGAAAAQASPSRWARVRDPVLDQQETVLAEAERLELQYRHVTHLRQDESGAEVGKIYLRQARDLLEQGGIGRARDPAVRFRLAELHHLLGEDAKAAPMLESILRDNPTAPVLVDTFSALAISYARLGRHEEEIKAYGKALLLEPHSWARATLLANRAEAYMVLGDITAAVAGYRQALSLLSSIEMIIGPGSTTLWGLAVALDRAGDLDSGIAAIQLARTYDAADKRLNGPGWFYVPWYDKYYYRALGYWSAARAATVNMAKDEDYRQSIASWEEYIASALPEDKWLALARARLRQCEKERDDWQRSARKKAQESLSPQKSPGPKR
jgi:tetratricopeptide (TPR) repeat protein